MKSLLKIILEKKLRFFAKAILARYNPEVIAITGSVGKTTTKEAIYTVLASTYKVRKNLKNYNNEIGIPLSIIGVESGRRSPFRWLMVFLKASWLIIFKSKNYPHILVLEMGADHPGDIKYLVDFVPLRVGVVTAVAAAHLEFFENINTVAKEKGELIKALSKTGQAVLNYDDKLVHQMSNQTKAKIIFFGLNQKADVNATKIDSGGDVNDIKGLSFKLKVNDTVMPVLLPKIFGQHLISSILAAIAVGSIYNLDAYTVVDSLKKFTPPKGRMNVIPGIKNTTIIDDSYNSSPLAAEQALKQLSAVKISKKNKKYAVLGDMLELGRSSEKSHIKIGEEAATNKIDYLITVGEMSRDTVKGAVAKKMSKDKCFNFKNSTEAGKFLQKRIAEGDLILVKGSQSVRMEHIVKELMAEPLKAKDLLVRQDKSWTN
ncbi:MAG: hypothetical protein CMI53_03020 [Parcubacteria group bacterium]|nr:hypothetical protein [Parcubacteria group bacterium]|tara:strand:- start:13031 stop:14323 length:1293 start_codon:yes stop_codon:yes gene_type:complete